MSAIELDSYVAIDRAIQEFVMDTEFNPDFKPSTDIKDAMAVEYRLYKLGFEVLTRRCMSMRCGILNSGRGEYGDFYCNISKDGESYFDDRDTYKSVARTLPLAICYSALKAMGVKITY
jgi:hypothetical protein